MKLNVDNFNRIGRDEASGARGVHNDIVYLNNLLREI